MNNSSSVRFESLKEMRNRVDQLTGAKSERVSDYFGVDVFDKTKMRQYLSKDVYESVISSIEGGRRIDRKVAGQVAAGMKTWAMERGATHYAHWFQPLTDSTAEKHDTFCEPLWGENRCIENFSGNLLVQQEPDASSFPTGGLRNTFEARGYTAWDPSSPAFVIDDTLCVPSIFIAYTGEALDYKTPLLRSLSALSKAAAGVEQYFDPSVEKVVTTLGWEQEYFLVDEALYNARPDLLQTGRTLMGHTAAKDQQLDDHYFGEIPERVIAYMKDLETACFRLGIPLKTRHNEAAPNQYECAPMYEEANIAVDHNALLMTLMKRIACKHHLHVLFHEKPYAGVNGSGKHCNWSLATIDGRNLLSPGNSPEDNLRFLTFFACTMKAAYRRGTMIMSSIATQSNAYRLGGNEAPPTVLSVFCGSKISEILDRIVNYKDNGDFGVAAKTGLDLEVGKIPEIFIDNTDRNRTSPFAFTGNRFEFRAAGSSANCAMPLLVINTAVAEQLTEFKKAVDQMTADGNNLKDAVIKVIRQYVTDALPVRFEGNGYSSQWREEAAGRGLEGINSVTAAIRRYILEDNVEMFERFSVLNRNELQSRFEIKNETYLKKVQIEARVIGDMAINHIIPVAIKYQNRLLNNVNGMKQAFPDRYKEMAEYSLNTIETISDTVNSIRYEVSNLVDARKKWNNVEDMVERACGYEKYVSPYLDSIRELVDKLEMIIDDSQWPLPKYRELFSI